MQSVQLVLCLAYLAVLAGSHMPFTIHDIWVISSCVCCCLAGHDHAYARTCPYAKGHCTSSQQAGAQQLASSSNAQSVQSSTAATDKTSRRSVVDTVTNPTAPVYILAGHAGAGFTHAFPQPLPDWVMYGAQDKNGYLRVTVKGDILTAVSVSTDDGHIMDGVKIVRTQPSS